MVCSSSGAGLQLSTTSSEPPPSTARFGTSNPLSYITAQPDSNQAGPDPDHVHLHSRWKIHLQQAPDPPRVPNISIQPTRRSLSRRLKNHRHSGTTKHRARDTQKRSLPGGDPKHAILSSVRPVPRLPTIDLQHRLAETKPRLPFEQPLQTRRGGIGLHESGIPIFRRAVDHLGKSYPRYPLPPPFATPGGPLLPTSSSTCNEQV